MEDEGFPETVSDRIRGFGNTKVDQNFLENAMEKAELEVIDPGGPDALPYGALIRYNGDSNVEGSPFFLPGTGQRCKGTAWVRDSGGNYIIGTDGKRLKRRCQRWPVKGGAGVCLMHGGGTQKAIALAKMRLLSAADAVTGALIKIATDEQFDAKVRVAACNSILDRVGIRAGVDVAVEIKPWQDLLKRLELDTEQANGTTIDGEWDEPA